MHPDTDTVTDDHTPRNTDAAPRRRGLRDTKRTLLATGVILALGAGIAVATTGGAPCPGAGCPAQAPDPATVIPSAENAPVAPDAARRAKQARRDRVMWPLNPTARDLTVRGVNIKKFLALGRCEAGPGDGYAGVRFRTPAGWRWQGAYGLYAQTHQSVGHPYGADAGQMTWQEQTLVAQRVMERYGIHAWGAASCYLAA